MYRNGKIYSFTVIHTAAEKFQHLVPYAIAIVDDGDTRFLVRIEQFDLEKLAVDADVRFDHLDPEGKPVYALG